MRAMLSKALGARGWKPGRHKGFLAILRSGIEFEVGQAPFSDRLELRYSYRTARTQREGEVVLSADAGLDQVLDAMTQVYFQVHEHPDYRRVLGRSPRSRPASSSQAEAGRSAAQGALDL